jgi:transposase
MCRWRRKKGDPREPEDHALGRSRGGFSTKLHLTCDNAGHPLTFELTAGQVHETQALVALLENADACVVDLEGTPVAWPEKIAADKGFRANWIDTMFQAMNIQPVIPSKANEDRDTRLQEFDAATYRDRNIIERLIGWLKENRRVFSRFEKTAMNYAGMIKMAFIHRYLKLATE